MVQPKGRPYSPLVQMALLDLDRAFDAAQWVYLSREEQDRASRFVFDRDRNRFVAGRSWLRQTLAGALDIEPKSLQFLTGQYGKPALDKPIYFNLSHSASWALLAYSASNQSLTDFQIGVDIEQGKSLYDAQRMYRHCLCERELDLIFSLEQPKQLDCFFTIWARKEAALKTHGIGFSIAPNQFDSMVGLDKCQIDLPNLKPVFVNDLSDHLPKTVQCKAAVASTHPMIQLDLSFELPLQVPA